MHPMSSPTAGLQSRVCRDIHCATEASARQPDMSITWRRVCPDIREPADVRRSWGSPEPSIQLCMSPHTQPDGTSQAMTLVPICATSLQKGRRHDARCRIAGTRPEEQQTPGEPGVDGVDNAARTRDLLNHNQMLYRLSYIHHVVWNPRNSRFRTTVKDYTRYQGRPLLGESFFRQTLPRNAISASSSRSAPAPSRVERPWPNSTAYAVSFDHGRE